MGNASSCAPRRPAQQAASPSTPPHSPDTPDGSNDDPELSALKVALSPFRHCMSRPCHLSPSTASSPISTPLPAAEPRQQLSTSRPLHLTTVPYTSSDVQASSFPSTSGQSGDFGSAHNRNTGSSGAVAGNHARFGRLITGKKTTSPKRLTLPGPVLYGRPEVLGLKQVDFISVHRKGYSGRIELLQGAVEGLSRKDETDLLIVYLHQRGVYKANRDSSLAALNRSGISIAALEKESKPEPSYRRHYNCWLTQPLPRPCPVGFEYGRLLIYENPGKELTRDSNIVMDIVKCLTAAIGCDVQIRSVLIPLSGALLSPSLRKHFVKAVVEVSYAWMRVGLPLRTVKILLPDANITRDIEAFRMARDQLLQLPISRPRGHSTQNDVCFSYAQEDKEAALEMISYLYSENPSVTIYEAKSRNTSVRKFGAVDIKSIEADNFVMPLFWRTCDLTPVVSRLVTTNGIDCREASMERARRFLDAKLSALRAKSPAGGEHTSESPKPKKLFEVVHAESTAGLHGDGQVLGSEKQLININKLETQNTEWFEKLDEQPDRDETDSQTFFDAGWRDKWAVQFKDIVFGPRIGSGGFGKVYKCKYLDRMVAVKTLQNIDDDDSDVEMAEFMVEAKLMSKLRHPNIVQFIGACIHYPRLVIILEFMKGGSLYRAINTRRRDDRGPFPVQETLWIAFSIAKGVAYLHSQRPVIIHRDLKSPNVLLGTHLREAKISDFGLSRIRVNSYVNTGPGGTPHWMAPELLRQESFNEKSDVFSFGVILWELVMCERPWSGVEPIQIVYKVGSRGQKLPTPPPESCDPEMRAMIVECLAQDPKRRPDFSGLAEKLEIMCSLADS